MCKFFEEEMESGTISRVQQYSPPFEVCGLAYIGKITIRNEENSNERYLAFVYSGNEDSEFPPTTKVLDAEGHVIPNDKLTKRLKDGMICDYKFKERNKGQQQNAWRITGLCIELRVRS